MDLVPVLPKRPLWADRQMIAAADLSAEQSWQDAQLARLRRYALGWGVVAGFEAEMDLTGALIIQPGYAISPLGHEAYLAAPLTWPHIKADLLTACLPEFSANCDDPRGMGDEYTEVSFDAWIVVTPESLQSCPRPLVAEGCGNAGNDWALSRQSGALRFEIVCDLQAGLLPDARACRDIQAQFARGAVPMPPDLPDMVPIALIGFTIFGVDTVSISERRRLFPLAELQAVVACGTSVENVEEVVVVPVPPPAESVWVNPTKHRFNDLFRDVAGFFPEPASDMNQLATGIFAARTGLPAPMPRFVKDPYQAFAAASLVSTGEELELWESGDFDKVFKAGIRRQFRFGGRPVTGLKGITLRQLIDVSPNFADFRVTYGSQEVAALEDLIAESGAIRQEKPGAVAILLFVKLRLDQMLQG